VEEAFFSEFYVDTFSDCVRDIYTSVSEDDSSSENISDSERKKKKKKKKTKNLSDGF